jgi:hypothetical protein
VGRIKFMGESTMGQVYEYFQAHMALAQHAWPRVIPIDNSRMVYAHDNMRAQGMHSEFHGLPTMLHNGQALEELASFRPAVVLHLQAANDAARDTFALYKSRLANYTDQLAAMRNGSDARLRGEALRARLLWVTAPVRHYKAGNGPGTAECKEGTLESCRAVDSGTSFRHIAGEVAWVTHPGAPPLFYGTLDRRRAFNAHAVAAVRAAFPDVQVVDFEAMTEALPSDYNMDGEHWGCNYEKWQGRRVGMGVRMCGVPCVPAAKLTMRIAVRQAPRGVSVPLAGARDAGQHSGQPHLRRHTRRAAAEAIAGGIRKTLLKSSPCCGVAPLHT